MAETSPRQEFHLDNIPVRPNDDDDAGLLLADYFRKIAAGPMTSYRRISQYGAKQGQSYYAHALDGVLIIHKLRAAGVVKMNDIEEQLLLAAYTVHDINKIEPYAKPDDKRSYATIATRENFTTELRRLGMDDFFVGKQGESWQDYGQDIWLLAHFHQYMTAPVGYQDRGHYQYKLPLERLEDLGKLMYAADHLDLSHEFAERRLKDDFALEINKVATRRYRWVYHHLGENRGLLTNIIHNAVTKHLRDKHATIIDLLYYPDGVAYLLPETEQLTWGAADHAAVAQIVASYIASRQLDSLSNFIKAQPAGIKVDQSAIDSGASFGQIMVAMRSVVERKKYKEDWHSGYLAKLQPDLDAAASNAATAELANLILQSGQPALPLEQTRLQVGEMAAAYRNLLEDHLKDKLKAQKRDPWTHVYNLLGLPAANHPLYAQVNGFRRGYFIARDVASPDLDTLYHTMLADLAALTGEAPAEAVLADPRAYLTYLLTNLEVSGGSIAPNFQAHLARYISAQGTQCSTCSSPLVSEELMSMNVASSFGVQVFTNRLRAGKNDPKRNVCAICRSQFIMERLAWPSHRDKHGGEATSFFLHLYPYSFFTSIHLNAIRSVLDTIRGEDSRAFFLYASKYYKHWGNYLDTAQAATLGLAANELDNNSPVVRQSGTNGIGIPNFSEVIGNTPTLPINAPGSNYGEQFIFALTHALMIADFFGCRVVMSRTPVPLLTDSFMGEHGLSFFCDGAPRNLRWLLPTDGYRKLATYKDDGSEEQRRKSWGDEKPDDDGFAAEDNVSRRLRALYRLVGELKSNQTKPDEELIVELAVAAADDPLAIYYIADRAIEKKVGAASKGTGGKGEGLATHLSRQVDGILRDMIGG